MQDQYSLDDVTILVDQLAVEVLSLDLNRRPIPTNMSQCLVDAALLLRRSDVEFSEFLSSAIQAVYRQRRAVSAPLNSLGKIIGFVDIATIDCVGGWALNVGEPEEPVILDLLVDFRSIATINADQMRSDLIEQQIGNGFHGFYHEFKPHLDRSKDHTVIVRRKSDDELLGHAYVRAAK